VDTISQDPLSLAPNFSITGDFEDSKFIVVLRNPTSREQKFVGESTGKHQVRDKIWENKWLFNLELDDPTYSQLLMAAVVFVTVTQGDV